MAMQPRRPRRPQYPPQFNVPSQAPSHILPYDPVRQADVAQLAKYQAPHQLGYGGAPPVYVVSTYDARPINGVDFTTMSGTNAGSPNGGVTNPDTGFIFGAGPNVGAYDVASLFYLVQPGRVATVRDFDIIALFATTVDVAVPILGINGGGASIADATLSFLVDGVFQEAMSSIDIWSLPFGAVQGECYIQADEGQTIEMRLSLGSHTATSFSQVLMGMHGNLLLKRGYQLTFEPGTDNVLPVHESGATALNEIKPSGVLAPGNGA